MTSETSTYYINPTLYEGRPSDCSNRLEKEVRVYDLLDKLGYTYKRLDHDPLPTLESCREAEQILGTDICKNLFLTNAQKTKFYLLLMPGDKKFKTKDLSKQINSARLSFAGPEYMEKFLDITPGSVSALGLMNDTENQVQLIIDKDVIEEHPYIGCHPCINTSTLRIKIPDFLNGFLPAVKHDFIVVDLPWYEE